MDQEISAVCEDIIEGILSGDVNRENLESKKLEYCSNHGADRVPKNSDIFVHTNKGIRDEVRKTLQTSPVRSSSGVAPVTVMTHPVSVCPHGRCHFCPAGEDSQFDDTQLSYPGGPSLMRAQQEDFDPYGQVKRRLTQLHRNGHEIDKIDLIIKSATVTSRSHDYQRWFVRRCLEAMNDYDKDHIPMSMEGINFQQENPEFKYLEDVIEENETGDVKCIGITFETKPDWCGERQIDRMLELGVTKTEIGVQTTFDKINQKMHRGHGSKESKKASKQLRDSGMKVGFHMMPGLPGMDKDMILEDFERIFDDPKWRPDYLKIYPCLVIPGTVVYDMWRKGNFEPLDSEEASDILSEVKEKIPKYVRLQRIQRDIPANQIEAGVQKSNLREITKDKMDDNCSCIRCREVGLNEKETHEQNLELNVMTYEASGGIEKFISIDDSKSDQLIGFLRLRFPSEPHREELQDASIVRELHVYGNQVGLDKDSGIDFQHKGYGEQLMSKAENLSIENGYDKISVISGIGARQYYKEKLDYEQDGVYVSKEF